MLPRSQPYALAGTGETHAGLFEDISTRSLQTVRVGESAGKISSGVGNAFVGYEAGKQNVAGSFTTLVGYQAGTTNTQGSFATMVGAYAGAHNTRGSEVTFVGYRAGELSRDGNQVVGIGAYALRENVSGNGTVAVGYRAGERTLDGYNNTMVGTESGQDNRSGNFNTMAGYRSGRSAFLGNENTYFGAFSGYSNARGSGNCFVGYKSGEELQGGDYNVAIGAYSMRMSQRGSCNVAIGPFAGAESSQSSTENVLIGTRVSEFGSANESVVIGAFAAQHMSGKGSVVIGHRTGRSLVSGDGNVLVGKGADTYTSSNSMGIAIGSVDTITSSSAISIGNSILNTREKSILVGFDLSSDADNSVVVGSSNTIQSVIFFKDPMSAALVDSVLVDGQSKLGMTSIDYANTLISPCNVVYPYAFAAPFASNLVNSFTNPMRGRTGPTTYDLRTFVPAHAIYHGASTVIRELPSTAIRFHPSNNLLSTSPGVALTYKPAELTLQDVWYRSLCNVQVTASTPTTLNIVNVQTLSNVMPFSWVFDAATPKQHTTECNVFVPFASTVTLSNIDWSLTYDSGVQLPNRTVQHIVTQNPSLGYLDQAVYGETPAPSYTLHPENLFATTDTFKMLPTIYVEDQEHTVHGMPASNATTIHIHRQPMGHTIYPATSIHFPGAYTSDPDDLVSFPPLPQNELLRFTQLDPYMKLVYGSAFYTSADVHLMAEKQLWDYPTSRYPSLIEGVTQRLQSVLACNQVLGESYCNLYLEGLRGEVIALQLEEPALDGLSMLKSSIEEFQETLIPPSIQTSNQFEAVARELFAWFDTFDTTLETYVRSSNMLRSNESFHASYFETGLHTQWLATLALEAEFFEHSRFTSDSSSSAFALREASLNYHTLVVPTIQDPPTLQEASFVYPTFANIYDLYFTFPRLFATYGDWKDGKISLEAIETRSTYQPLRFNLQTSNISIPFTAAQSATWTSLDVAAFSRTNQASTQRMHTVSLPNQTVNQWYLANPPKHGILACAPSTLNTSNIQYFPTNPFAQEDSFHIVLQNDLHETVDVVIPLSWKPTIRTSNVVIPATPHTESRTGSFDHRIQEDIHVPYQACNVTILWNSQQGIHPPNPEIIEEPITQYDPMVGYFVYTSNVFTCNVLLVQEDPLGVGNLVQQSNIIYTFETFPAYSRSVSNLSPDPVTYPVLDGVFSNEFYWDLRTITHCNLFASNTTIQLVDTLESTSLFVNDLDPSSMVLYQRTLTEPVNPPRRTKLVEQATTSTLRNTTQFFTERSNITFRDAYVPLTPHHVFVPNPSFHVSQVVYHKDVGPVSDLHMSNVFDRRYWVKAGTPSMTLQDGQHPPTILPVQTVSVAKDATPPPFRLFECSVQSDTLRGASLGAILQQIAQTAPFPPTNVHLIDAPLGSWCLDGSNLATTVPWSQVPSLQYVPFQRQTVGPLQLVFSSNEQSSYVHSVNLNLLQDPSPLGQDWNVGVGLSPVYHLSSNQFFHTVSGLTPQQIKVQLLTLPFGVTASLGEFTMKDVIEQRVRLEVSGNFGSAVMSYQLSNISNPTFPIPLGSEYSFPLRSYNHQAYPHPGYVDDARIAWTSVQGNRSTSNVLQGHLWSWLQNIPQAPNDITFHVTQDGKFNHGHLASNQSLVTSHTLSDLVHNAMQYISKTPGQLPNDALTYRIAYNASTLSPPYHVSWKNYIAHFSPTAIEVSSMSTVTRTVPTPQISQGLADDGYMFSPSPSVIPQRSNVLSATIPVSWTFGNLGTGTWQLSPFVSSAPVKLVSPSIALTVDQADRVSLSVLTQTYHVDRLHAPVIRIHVTQHPQHGVLMDVRTGQPITTCTESDLLSNAIVYQHVGATTETDSMTVVFATNLLDASQAVQVAIQIRPMPTVVINNDQYVIFESPTSAEAPQTFAPSSLQIQGTGFVHFVSVENASLSASTVSITQLGTTSWFLDPGVLTSATGQGYRNVEFTIAINQTASPMYVNPLVTIPEYRNVFLFTHTAHINRFEDIHQLIADVPADQSITYNVDPLSAAALNMRDRTVTFSIQVQPLPSFDHPSAPLLKEDSFTWKFLGANQLVLLQFDVDGNNWTLSTPQRTNQGTLPSPLTRFTWNTIRIVNGDPRNNDRLSIYWKFNPISKNIVNLLAEVVVPKINFQGLQQICVDNDIYDSGSFIANTTVVVPFQMGVQASFTYVNSYVAYLYRNFEVSISTYASGTTSYDATTHNVVMGKALNVRGTNNICIGNQFTTSGQKSIIVGNDIGVTNLEDGTASLNDIFQSIIIGNESFQNSIVRDVICIGNQNLNDLTEVSVAAVQEFLGQKPIIIGNNIQGSSVDYHINVGNAFLKTSRGGEQIYLGNTGEAVAIGYRSNEALSSVDHSLYVAGSMRSKTVCVDHVQSHGVAAVNLAPYRVVTDESVDATQAMSLVYSSNLMNPLVVGVVDSSQINVATNSWNVKVHTSGRVRVWCTGSITRGDLLASHPFGLATRVNTSQVQSFTFAKSLTSWDPLNPSATPWVSLSNIEGVDVGLISCVMIHR
jgi:hypothetical protein